MVKKNEECDESYHHIPHKKIVQDNRSPSVLAVLMIMIQKTWARLSGVVPWSVVSFNKITARFAIFNSMSKKIGV
ncbi:hypothetical protein [Xenorhabdus entomophaga]|uniref:hypothetical protein n=1 Tax=Xenorhabdus entomophaga TaxID=3136257 RepID=UPI003BF5A3BE